MIIKPILIGTAFMVATFVAFLVVDILILE